MSEALKIITENTAKYCGGRFQTKSYVDFLDLKPVDNRSGEEIAADIIKRAELVVV